MFATCANSFCLGSFPWYEGKLFRLDFEIVSGDGAIQQKTMFVWLCSRCAQHLALKVEVVGDTVRVLLARIPPPVTMAVN